MRLVRFEDPVDGDAVDLHPLLTVVTGAHRGVRERLLQAVSALPRGADPGAGGSVEVHGVVMDLSLESLALLELGEDLDVVVRADDLPGRSVASADAEAPATDPRSAVLRSELDSARRAHDEAIAAVEQAEELRVELRRQLDAVADQRRWLASELEGARATLAPSAEADLHAARDDLAVVRQRSEDAVAALAAERARLEAELARATDRSAELQRELAELDIDHSPAVREALDALVAALEPELVPSPQARDIAEELSLLDERLALLESRAATSRAQVQELTARRDAAYDVFVAAEAALRTPELDRDAVAELEAIHDEIFELDGRIAKLSAGRLRRRMLELRDRERELLDQLGFESWSSYVMGLSSEDAESERKRRYDVAKATYEFAEDEVAKAAAAPMVASSELAEAQVRRRELLARAEELLGRPVDDEDVVSDLRAHRVRADADLPAATIRLRIALETARATGVPGEAVELRRFTESWLTEEITVRRRRATEAADERREVDSTVTRLWAEIDALPEDDEVEDIDPDDHPDVIAAQSRIDELIARLDLHRKAAALIEEFAALDAEQAAREAELQVRAASAEASVGEAQELARTAAQLIEQIETAIGAIDDDAGVAPLAARSADGPASAEGLEWYVLGRLARQRSISFVGSVPLAIDDAFAEWSAEELGGVHTRLARMSEVIQVLYISDDVDVVRWARELGHERASVVDLSTAASSS